MHKALTKEILAYGIMSIITIVLVVALYDDSYSVISESPEEVDVQGAQFQGQLLEVRQSGQESATQAGGSPGLQGQSGAADGQSNLQRSTPADSLQPNAKLSEFPDSIDQQ